MTVVEGEIFLGSGHILDNHYRPILLINNRKFPSLGEEIDLKLRLWRILTRRKPILTRALRDLNLPKAILTLTKRDSSAIKILSFSDRSPFRRKTRGRRNREGRGAILYRIEAIIQLIENFRAQRRKFTLTLHSALFTLHFPKQLCLRKPSRGSCRSASLRGSALPCPSTE